MSTLYPLHIDGTLKPSTVECLHTIPFETTLVNPIDKPQGIQYYSACPQDTQPKW